MKITFFKIFFFYYLYKKSNSQCTRLPALQGFGEGRLSYIVFSLLFVVRLFMTFGHKGTTLPLLLNEILRWDFKGRKKIKAKKGKAI